MEEGTALRTEDGENIDATALYARGMGRVPAWSFKIGEETMEEFLAERENLANPRFAPMETGHTYTFMLRHTPFDSDLWMAAAEPYRFKHVSDGRAFPEGTYSDSGKGVEIVTQTALQSRLEERAGQA